MDAITQSNELVEIKVQLRTLIENVGAIKSEMSKIVSIDKSVSNLDLICQQLHKEDESLWHELKSNKTACLLSDELIIKRIEDLAVRIEKLGITQSEYINTNNGSLSAMRWFSRIAVTVVTVCVGWAYNTGTTNRQNIDSIEHQVSMFKQKVEHMEEIQGMLRRGSNQ